MLDGEVHVRSPYHVPQVEIDDWVQSRASWIDKQKASIEQKAQELPCIEHLGHCYIFGSKKTIVFSEGEKEISIAGDQLVIASPAGQFETDFTSWLQQKAISYLSERINYWAQTIGVSSNISKVVFKVTKTKWGHCTSKGVIQLNWYLIMAPKSVIDYVVIHELCHFFVMNHSAKFWANVEKYCPDYRQEKKWLRIEGHKLWL